MEVADENDNEPQFERNVYEFRVLESASPGFEIGRVRAVDKDVDNTVKYQIFASDGVENYFRIEETTGF